MVCACGNASGSSLVFFTGGILTSIDFLGLDAEDCMLTVSEVSKPYMDMPSRDLLQWWHLYFGWWTCGRLGVSLPFLVCPVIKIEKNSNLRKKMFIFNVRKYVTRVKINVSTEKDACLIRLSLNRSWCKFSIGWEKNLFILLCNKRCNHTRVPIVIICLSNGSLVYYWY